MHDSGRISTKPDSEAWITVFPGLIPIDCSKISTTIQSFSPDWSNLWRGASRKNNAILSAFDLLYYASGGPKTCRFGCALMRRIVLSYPTSKTAFSLLRTMHFILGGLELTLKASFGGRFLWKSCFSSDHKVLDVLYHYFFGSLCHW